MPYYTLDELIKKMEPQYVRDKTLMRECTAGLTLYAAQYAARDMDSPKIAEMRNLVELLACYWGLDDGGEAKLQRDFLRPFDNLIGLVPSGASLDAEIVKYRAATILGLHRYGIEMAFCQGADCKDDILAMRDLMHEIARAWDFESPVLENMAHELESEVRRLETVSEKNPSVLAQIRNAAKETNPRPATKEAHKKDKSGPEH